MFTLTKFDAARRALAEAHRVDEIKAIRDKAEALRLYFKQQGENLVMQNQAAEIKLRAERKAGTLLTEMEKAKGGGDGSNQYGKSNRSHGVTSSSPTLADIGITKIQSHRFQRVARIPEHLFEQFIEQTVAVGGELTTKGLLECHPDVRSPSPPRAPSATENLPQYLELKQGDALTVLKTLPDESVDMVLTSPPYYGLRDYSIAGQIGLESTLEEYLAKMLAITAELKRVLKKTGTMWWNHGDSYGSSIQGERKMDSGGDGNFDRLRTRNTGEPISFTKAVPEKSLLLQAHRLAIRMIEEQGWILRNQLIWHKPNVMPSSAEDRFTVDYEPIFFFSKSKTYWFEPQYEPHQEVSLKRAEYGWHRGKEYPPEANVPQNTERMGERYVNPRGRNKRCVWTIPTQPFPDAHFAVYPPELCEIPIKAGCPEYICTKCGKAREKIFEPAEEYSKLLGKCFVDHSRDGKEHYGTKYNDRERQIKVQQYDASGKPKYESTGYTDCGCNSVWEAGIVLDPFFGTGTTAIVAHRLNRSWIGIELSEEYIRIAKRRLVEHGIQPSSVSTAGVRAPLL